VGSWLAASELPGSLVASHDMIRRLREALAVTEAKLGKEIGSKEETLEGLSDLFALRTLMPEQTRLFKEHQEATAKYRALVAELAAARAEADALREGQDGGLERTRAALEEAQRVAGVHERALAEEKARADRATARAIIISACRMALRARLANTVAISTC